MLRELMYWIGDPGTNRDFLFPSCLFVQGVPEKPLTSGFWAVNLSSDKKNGCFKKFPMF